MNSTTVAHAAAPAEAENPIASAETRSRRGARPGSCPAASRWLSSGCLLGGCGFGSDCGDGGVPDDPPLLFNHRLP